ncbi:MAG: nascent polypeptide-associated complex protein [Nanoarchaeota archaeon]
MKINPKQLEKMAKRMGIQSEPIDAEEVIIKTSNNDIVISNPQVARVNMMGQDTFQVSGDVSERSREKFSKEDIEMIMEQAGVSEEDAKKAIKETGDMAEAILKLKKSK